MTCLLFPIIGDLEKSNTLNLKNLFVTIHQSLIMNICKIFLVFAILAIASCKKKNDEYLLRYTRNMNGPHKWTGMVVSNGVEYPYTTDKSIVCINDSTLSFWSIRFGTVTYNYWTSSASEQTISFTAENHTTDGVSDDTLIYYYNQNIIHYNSLALYKGPATAYHLHTP